MATWTKIKTEGEYTKAVDRINELIDSDRTDIVRNELGFLSYLIEEYEAMVYPLPDASPLEVIKWVMEMKSIKQKDLIPILGTKGNVSKILSGKAKLQVEDIYPLSTLLGIPAEALIMKKAHRDADDGVTAKYAEPIGLQAMDKPEKYRIKESPHRGVSSGKDPVKSRKKNKK